MPFDFKKEYRELYYIAVRGTGDPNEDGGAYQQAISVLYAVAYTLKMSYKTDYKIAGFFEYVVPPLEGFWRQDNVDGVNYSDKSGFHWVLVAGRYSRGGLWAQRGLSLDLRHSSAGFCDQDGF